ncbi:hypothetical protein EII31_02275 [Leucobacter sp. OH2974_COT-288]|nr:hypothetical protein EII31_02275 [Leucobacter sp. OH2974_COT-288]
MSRLTTARIIAWIASAVLALISLAAAFVYLQESDGYAPEFVTHGFQIKELTELGQPSDVISDINAAAAHGEANIYKPDIYFAAETVNFDYYLFAADSSGVYGSVVTGTFPAFGKKYPQRLLPAADIRKESILLGTYYVDGDLLETKKILDYLSERGITATLIVQPQSWLQYWISVVNTTWGGALFIATISLFVALLNLCSCRLTIPALRRAVGVSKTKITIYELGEIVAPLCLAVVMPGLLLTLYAVIFADGYRVQTIAVITLSQLIITLILAAVFAFVVFVTVGAVASGRLLKGWQPLKAIAVSSALTIIMSSFFVGSAANEVSAAYMRLVQSDKANASLQSAPGLVRPAFSYSILAADNSLINAGMREIFRQLESEGSALVIQSDFAGENDNQEPESKLAVVNANFCRLFTNLPETLISELEESALQQDVAVAVFPQELSGADKDNVIKQINEWLEFQQSIKNPDVQHEAVKLIIQTYEADAIPTMVFDETFPTLLESPVLLAISANNLFLSDEFYANNGIYTDVTQLEQALENQDIRYAIAAFDDIAAESSLYLMNQKSQMVIAASGMLASLVMLVLGSIILTGAYFSSTVQAIFLKTITGNSFWVIHRTFILATATFVTAPLLWSTVFLKLPHLIALSGITVMTTVVISSTYVTLKIFSRTLNSAALEMS